MNDTMLGKVRSQMRLVDVEMMVAPLAGLNGKEPLLLPDNVRGKALETAQESVRPPRLPTSHGIVWS